MMDIVQDYTKNGMPSICLDAPCTYTTQRKHTLSDKGGVHMPHTFGCPHSLDAPVCLDAPHVWMAPYMFGCTHMPSCMFGHPICLDALYVWVPPVWMPMYA